MERRKLKLAFLDTIGTAYTGDTLERKGLGGSESAIIYMSKELTELDFDVTVFNKCEKEGTYNGVRYLDLSKAKDNQEEFDILVNSRTVLPYVPLQYREAIMEEFRLSPTLTYDIADYKAVVDRSRHKILWLHDTFIMGENWFEDVLADGYFDEVFTLSDFHTHYIARARHGNRERFFEVLKRKMFQTRNGIKSFYDEVDISAKDPNLFVYNASTTKGLVPLLRQIWPLVKKELPKAKLTVIGGYYNLGFSQPDEIETLFRQLQAENEGKDDVTFTGIITQKEVADIMVKASFYIYPATFPETFGISAAEAMNYNVPLLTTRFGALEEIAPESTSYMIDFPITKDMEHYHRTNPIAEEGQVVRFVEMVKKAYNDPYLRQQKMYAANEFKPFLGWDTVALQWKYHLIKKLGLYMDREETQKFRYISGNLRRLYDRRFTNPEEKFEDYSMEHKNEIAVISPTYNAWRFTPAHIMSVASQLYDNYTHYLIDDMSTDSTVRMARETIATLPESIRDRFKIIVNTEKKSAVWNQFDTIKQLKGNPIIVLLDGDDFLDNDPDIFNYVNRLHNRGAKFTYGSMYSLADKINLVAQPYPKDVLKNRTYRDFLFNWGMPYTHLRTFRKEIFDKVDESNFKDEKGNFWKAGGDNSMFYPLMDKCQPDEIQAVQRILVRYNDLNPLNDYKVNSVEQTQTARTIRDSKYENMVRINEPTPNYTVVRPDMQDMAEVIEKVRLRNREIMSHIKDTPKSFEEIAEGARSGDEESLAKLKLWNRYNKLFPIYHDEAFLPEQEKFRFDRMTDIVRKKFSNFNGKSILDIGSGDGILTRRLMSMGFSSATCVDSSMRGVEKVSQVYTDINWVNKDILDYETDEKFDLIILGNVLNVLSNPRELLWMLKEKNLKPGGTIIFSVYTDQMMYGNDETITNIDRKFLEENFDTINEFNHLTLDLVQYDWYIGSFTDRNPVNKKIKGEKTSDNLLAIDDDGLEYLRSVKDENLMSGLKDILKNREEVWIDSVEALSIAVRLKWLKSKMEKLPRSHKILDLGSWTGSIANEISMMGFKDITCVDISEKVVKKGAETFPHLKWMQSDIESLKIDQKFDVIIMMEILEHLADPELVIEKLRGMLRPGGLIVYTTPTEDFVFQEGSHEHITLFDMKRVSAFSTSVEKIRLDKPEFEWYAGTVETKKEEKMGKILIAIPTAKNIETDTFKSIYRLIKPEGYTVDFECFYGYNIDQVRNLMAHYTVSNNYDYIYYVDYDMILPEESLVRLLSHDKDIVSGLYIQRRTDEQIPEMYTDSETGGMRHLTVAEATVGGVIELAACGFGGVLIKRRVLEKVGYPYFTYHHSIDFKDTLSEDVDFCMKASNRGFKIHLDTDLVYTHIGRIDLHL